MNSLKRHVATATGALAGLLASATAQAGLLSTAFGGASTDHQVAGTVTLLGLGLAGFVVLRKRRSTFHAMRAEQKAASDRARGIKQIDAAA